MNDMMIGMAVEKLKKGFGAMLGAMSVNATDS